MTSPNFESSHNIGLIEQKAFLLNDKILVVSERWWPDGTGGVLASHLIVRVLRDAGFKLTVVHGTREPMKLKGVNYIYTGLLGVRNKQRL